MASKPSAHAKGLLVLDSSCWLEFFKDSARADLYALVVQEPAQLIVPVITLYEVTKKLRREINPVVAGQAESMMRRSPVIDIDAAQVRMAITYALPLPESLIYATAQAHGAVLWTQDAHFEGLAGVRYFEKKAL